MTIIRIQLGEIRVRCELLSTPTAPAIAAALPITARASIWGDEVYFSTPVEAALESDARDLMTLGEVAYWPPGKAIALGFGPTPASQGDEIRLASPANVFARAIDDLRDLASVRAGTEVEVTMAEEDR
jgi:hypothetical protein